MPLDDTSEGTAARVAAFGRWLAQERELRGVSQADVAATTKLPSALVEALESGDAARMPPSAYVVGYLRSYAGAVGLDPDEVVLRWQESAPSAPAAPAPGARARDVRLVVALVLALALAGAGAWALLALG
ncbi:MAG TPA: helix-turn-helix transcriptional regulator [Anaeromyxobacteraceae bacterium]|nr:helix-turn-helix transcriptional regulator [Anaeromyxobacteraceae bacterium]